MVLDVLSQETALQPNPLLFSSSFSPGPLHSCEETANITPVYEKCSKIDLLNYRLISLPPHNKEMMESIIAADLRCYVFFPTLIIMVVPPQQFYHGYIASLASITDRYSQTRGQGHRVRHFTSLLSTEPYFPSCLPRVSAGPP